MATPLYRPSNCVWQGSSTATTGGTVTLDVAALTGKLNFRDRYADGATGVPLELYDSTSGIYEFSYGTLHYGGGGPTTDTIASRVALQSTNGPGTPVAWGSGTRDAFCNLPAESFLFAENAFAEMSDAQAASGLTRLGVAFGASPGNTVRLDPSTGKYPAADGSLITGLPASPIPAGTRMLFYQAAAPVGWTQITSIDDMVIGITNGSGTSGGGPHAGGTTGGIGWDASFGLSVGGHVLTQAEIPLTQFGSPIIPNTGSAYFPILTQTSSSHNHPISSASTWRPLTAYTILCSKN